MTLTDGQWQSAGFGSDSMLWSSFHFDQLASQVEQVDKYVTHHIDRPNLVAAHFESILALLRDLRPRSDLHDAALKLINLLHPWPVRWGHWQAWEREMQFALSVAEQSGNIERRAAFLTYLASIKMAIGNLAEALDIARQAISLARKYKFLLPLAESGSIAINILRSLGQIEKSEKLRQSLDDFVIKAQDQFSERLITIAQAYLSQSHLVQLRRQGEIDVGITLADDVIKRLRNIQDTDTHLLAQTYKSRATLYWAKEKHWAAIQDLKLAIDLFSKEGDSFAEAEARGDLGVVYYSTCQYGRAETTIRYCLKQAEVLNARNRLVSDIGNLAAVCMARGELRQALFYLKRQQQLAIQSGNSHESSRAQGNLATIQLCLGKYDEAFANLEYSLVMFQQQERMEAVITTMIELSWCHDGLGERQKATKMVKKAHELACQFDQPILQMFTLRHLAQYPPYITQVELLNKALTLAKQYGRRLDEAACLLMLSQRATSTQEKDMFWEQGSKVLWEIGASAWLITVSPKDPPRIPYLL